MLIITSKRSLGKHLRQLSFTLLIIALANISLAQPPRRIPPAPVPDTVTMPRPSAEEVDLAHQTLASFMNNLDREAKALFDSYPYLLEVRPPGINTAIVPDLSPNFRAKHEANLEVARGGDIDVLFMGDSITDFWRNETGNYAGKPVLDEYFSHLKIANFGIAGDTTQGVLYRLQNGEGEGYSPKAVMLMIGTNNTRTHRTQEIAEGVGAIVLQLQSNFPETKILLLGIFPRGKASDSVSQDITDINGIISNLHDNEKVFYLDIGKVFVDSNGDVPPEIMSDGLHPSPYGYELWAEAVKGPLEDLL